MRVIHFHKNDNRVKLKYFDSIFGLALSSMHYDIFGIELRAIQLICIITAKIIHFYNLFLLFCSHQTFASPLARQNVPGAFLRKNLLTKCIPDDSCMISGDDD